MPTNTDGSVDRETSGPPTARSTERVLTEIWTQILGQSVGAQDHFIDFTDSLSATEYVNHVREAFHVDIPATALFESIPNVSKLAKIIDELGARAGEVNRSPETPAAAPTPSTRPVRARSHDLAVTLPGGSWRVWRTAALRGAGFPASMIGPLASTRTADAARRYMEARQEVDRLRLAALRELGTLARTAADAETRTALRRTRRRVRQGVARPDAPLGSEAALAAAFARRSAACAELASIYDTEYERVTASLLDLLADGRFREAVLWQNRMPLRLASKRLRDRHGSAGARRNAATFLAMLAQRYATKNDTLGFFGPVGWARLADSPTYVDITPGPRLLAHREVYFEGWAIDAVAEALDRNPALKPWTAPRLNSGVWVGPDHVVVPVTAVTAVSAAQRRLLAWCDGTRTARDIASLAIGETPPLADSEAAVFDMLRELVERKLLTWRLEVPSQSYPERELAQRIARIGDAALRTDGERTLRALTDAKARVAAAAGDDGALESALADLDATFTTITGLAASRRHGEMYAARGLVFEDCRRDCEVAFGAAFLSRLGPPLSIVLDGARWVSTELRAAFTRELRACLAQLTTALGTETVDAHLFMTYVGNKGRELTAPISRRVLEQFQERWRSILGAARHTWAVADVEERAREAFATTGPASWGGYFCPDVMIASPSREAFQAGQFHAVLGEVHSNNTLLWSALVNQHPDAASLLSALAEDTQDDTVVLVQTPKARWVSRLHVTTLPTFWRYEHGEDLPSLQPCRSLPAALLVAADDGRMVRIRARDDRVDFDAYELFAVTLSYEADRIVSAMVRGGAHSPRVTIGDLTVAREQWHTTPDEMPFLGDTDPHLAFARLHEWASAHGMPRHVFYKSAGETKPCYLDFESPLYASVFLKLMRRLRGTAAVRIVEMLPGLADAWLPDREGSRYTSEIRIVARRDE